MQITGLEIFRRDGDGLVEEAESHVVILLLLGLLLLGGGGSSGGGSVGGGSSRGGTTGSGGSANTASDVGDQALDVAGFKGLGEKSGYVLSKV